MTLIDNNKEIKFNNVYKLYLSEIRVLLEPLKQGHVSIKIKKDIQKKLDLLYSTNEVEKSKVSISLHQCKLINILYGTHIKLFVDILNKSTNEIKLTKSFLKMLNELCMFICKKISAIHIEPYFGGYNVNLKELAMALMVAALNTVEESIMDSDIEGNEIKFVYKSTFIYMVISILKKMALQSVLAEGNVSARNQKMIWEITELSDFSYEHIEGMAHMIIDTLTHVGFFTAVLEKTKRSNKIRLLVDISNEAIYPFQKKMLPRVIQPLNWKYDGTRATTNGKEFVGVDIFGGASTITFSKKCIDALNVMQRCKFKINNRALVLYKNLNDQQVQVQQSVNYTSKARMEILSDELNDLKKSLDNDITSQMWDDYRANYKSFRHVEILRALKDGDEPCFKEVRIKAYQSIGVPNEIEFIINKIKILILKIDQCRKHNRKIAHMIDMAELFSGVDIYFGVKIDYRGRSYPDNYLFSRVTGQLKNIINVSDPYDLNVAEATNLINQFLGSVDKIKQLKSLAEAHSYWLQKKKERVIKTPTTMYGTVLLDEVNRLFPLHGRVKRKSRITIEIDQSFSGGVFLGLLLGIKSLWTRVNLTGEVLDKSDQAYNHLMNTIVQSMHDENASLNGRVQIDGRTTLVWPVSFITLINFRNFFKKLFMTYIYSQTDFGRIAEIKKILKENNRYIESGDFRCVLALAYKFPEYIESAFPGLNSGIDIWKSSIKLVIKERSEISYRTLDGSVCTWSKWRRVKMYKKYWCVFTKSWKSYNIQKFNPADVNVEGTLRASTSGFIHLIDGSIVRMVSYMLFDEHRIFVACTHDSFQVRLNDVEKLYNVLYKIYTCINWDTLIKDLYVETNRSALSSSNQQLFDIKISELLSRYEKVPIDGFNPKLMYKFEDI